MNGLKKYLGLTPISSTNQRGVYPSSHPGSIRALISAFILITGSAFSLSVLSVQAASVGFTWESCSGKACDDIDTDVHYSGEYTVKGSGLLIDEVIRSVDGDGKEYKGSTKFQYYDPDSLDWKTAYYHWVYGTNDYNVVDRLTLNGYKRYMEKIYNADSYPLRLGVVPAYWIGGFGNYEQFAGSMYFSETFIPFESALMTWYDLAGGAKDNPQTVFHPSAESCPGLPQYSVNTAWLNLVIEDNEFGCSSLGHQVELRRVWNMPPTKGGMYGKGWSSAYESTIKVKKERAYFASLRLASGQELEFKPNIIEKAGEHLIAIQYDRYSLGIGPMLSAAIDETTGAGTYTYTDMRSKMTQVYAFSGTDSANWVYRLQTVKDRNGNTITLGYDSKGRLVKLTDSSGRITSFIYDANHRVVRMRTFDGRGATYAYDAAGNLIRNVDLLGTVIRYGYDAKGYLLTMNVAGLVTKFGYGVFATGETRIASVTEPDGRLVKYEGSYASGSARTTYNKVIDANGGEYEYTNVDGRTTSIETPGHNGSTWIGINDQYLIDEINPPRGNISYFEYDANGNLTKAIDPTGQTTTYAYDDRWNLTQVTDALGHATQYVYDSRDNLIRVTSPLGRVTQYTRDAKGLVTRITRPDGKAYQLAYDVHGNLIHITDPLGKITQMAYDAWGLNPIALTDPRGNRTGFGYDANRRLTAITQADGKQIRYIRNCCALTGVRDGAGQLTSIQRDASYRLTGVTNPLGYRTRLNYNADGDLIRLTDPLGRIAEISYDPDHQPITLKDPLGGTIELRHDPNGNLDRLTDERGEQTWLSYDLRDELKTVEDPLGVVTHRYTRDALGRLASLGNARDQLVKLMYDADGRPVGKQEDGRTIQYDWDVNDQLSAVSDESGTLTYTRDARGQVIRITYPDGKTIRYAYDAAGNPVSLTYPGGVVVSYTYDAMNRVASVAFGGRSLSLGYDAAGNRISETRSNGVNSRYDFDAARQLVRVSHRRGDTILADIGYTRNAAGLITQENGIWPLRAIRTTDPATATYDAANGLLTWNADTFTHDADGNLIGRQGSRAFSAEYDAENRLIAFTGASGQTTRFSYDGLGHRVTRQTAQGTTRYYHDPAGRLLSQMGPDQSLTHFIYADGRLIASGSPARGYVFHHFDKTGNTLALTNGSGQKVGAFAYDPYGKVVARSGSVSTPFTYVGEYGVMEEADNLFFMRHRYYDADLQRFVQRDPIGFESGVSNLYSYVNNNPVYNVDPSGLMGGSDFVDDRLLYLWNSRNPEWGAAFENSLESVDIAISSHKKIGPLYSLLKIALKSKEPESRQEAAYEAIKLMIGLVGNVPGMVVDLLEAGNAENVRRVQEYEELWRKEQERLRMSESQIGFTPKSRRRCE